MHLFTDSKAALWEAVCRPSERLSSIEIGREGELDDLLARVQRSARGPSKAILERQPGQAVSKEQERGIGYER
jgi:hypothetical protein